MASEKHAAPAWYLIQCKSRQDARAEEHLLRQGYSCLRPKMKHERLLRGRMQIVEESLFPGYLFIQLSHAHSWAPLRSTRGVLRVVGFGGMPLAIDEAVILRIQQHEGRLQCFSSLAAGDRVCITDGPFAELEAIFLAMDGEERVVLLMNFLHREQKIRLPLGSIVKRDEAFR